MRFGVLYNIDYHQEIHGSASRYYGAILDQEVALEELGYDSVWFGEHPYARYSFGSPATMAMAAAARTKTIRVGTGVSLVPLHHRLRLAVPTRSACCDDGAVARLIGNSGRAGLHRAGPFAATLAS